MQKWFKIMQNCIILLQIERRFFMHPKLQLEKLIAFGFTQEDVAKATAVAQSTISRILNGEIENPKWIVAHRINEMYVCQTTKSPNA